MFFPPRDVWICRSSSSGNEDILRLYNFGHIIIANKFNLMIGDKSCQFVVVFNLLSVELLAVAKVEGADVVLDLLRDGLPVIGGVSIDIPAGSVQVFLWFSEESSVVEQLLGDASHVHACAYVIYGIPPSPHLVPWGEGLTKSATATLAP